MCGNYNRVGMRCTAYRHAVMMHRIAKLTFFSNRTFNGVSVLPISMMRDLDVLMLVGINNNLTRYKAEQQYPCVDKAKFVLLQGQFYVLTSQK